jgi:hypothetical protein
MPMERNMTTLPEFFTQSSDGLYDRHSYKLYFKNGKAITFGDYQSLMSFWFQYGFKGELACVDVIDKPKPKKKPKKGF